MTLLPILLALGMHPQLTPVPPSCFLQDHPPGIPCHDISRDEHSSTSFGPPDDYGTITTPAHPKPKPKRKAKPVVPERKWAICAYDGTDGSILSCAVDARFLFSPDKHPEGVGDSKQPTPDPVLAKLEAISDRQHDDETGFGIVCVVGLFLFLMYAFRRKS